MREVVITDNAKGEIEQIAFFLEHTYSNKTKVEFLVKLSEKLLFIESMPFMYPSSTKNPRVRKCIVHKNSVCFYEVKNDKIIILEVADSRIDPDIQRF